jgi:hypothetical protein
MSRAFVREQDIEVLDELSDRVISPHPNDVADEGMKQLESTLVAAYEALAAALRMQRVRRQQAFKMVTWVQWVAGSCSPPS